MTIKHLLNVWVRLYNFLSRLYILFLSLELFKVSVLALNTANQGKLSFGEFFDSSWRLNLSIFYFDCVKKLCIALFLRIFHFGWIHVFLTAVVVLTENLCIHIYSYIWKVNMGNTFNVVNINMGNTRFSSNFDCYCCFFILLWMSQ